MMPGKLSIEQLAGQRLMVGFTGRVFNEDIKNLVKNLNIGGVVLFAGNIESPDQVRTLCSSIQQYAHSCGLPPLFIAVDQEGGEVARLKTPHFTPFPGNPHIKDRNDAETFARITSSELKQVKINMNLAPVMDIVPEGFDSIMKNRAFKGSPEQVAEIGTHVIETLQEQGIMAVAKHFPGIGRTVIDSHLDLPVLDAEYPLLEKTDFLPFIAAKQSNVSAMMLSHILYPGLDSQWPASLSPRIAKDLLRDNLGYNGIVMTDDLDMKAVKHPITTCVEQILKAQIDIALICHKGPDIEEAYQQIVKLLSDDSNLLSRAIESCDRILKTKNYYLA